MPIKTVLLNTPKNPGDNDPGVTYPRAAISEINVWPSERRMAVVVSFGDLVDGGWRRGRGLGERTIIVSGDEFEARFDATIAALTNWLISNGELDGIAE